MIKTNVINGTLSDVEITQYIDTIKNNNPSRRIKEVDFEVDGEFVNVSYKYDEVPFDRIRRITGYLVGTMDRFNNAKKSEVDERVKHGVN